MSKVGRLNPDYTYRVERPRQRPRPLPRTRSTASRSLVEHQPRILSPNFTRCGILFAYAAGGLLSAHALSLSMAAPPAALLLALLWLPETPSFLISIGRVQSSPRIPIRGVTAFYARVASAHALSLSMAAPPAALLLALLWLPETPSFLISIGRVQDAAKVMCWFEGSDFREDLTDVIEQQEVRIRTSESYGSQKRAGLCRMDSETFQPMLKRSSGLESNSEKKTEPSACRELFHNQHSRRALLSCCVLLAVSAGSGAGAVTSYAASVLQHSAHASAAPLNHTASNVTVYNGTATRGLFNTSEAASILCGTALVLGAAVAIVTVDKVGRKMLLIWSCSGIACCLALLGAYCDPRLRMFSWSHTNQLWLSRHKPIEHTNAETPKPINVANSPMNMVIPVDKESVFNGTKDWHQISIGNITKGELKTSISKVEANSTTYDPVEEDTIWPPLILLSTVLFLFNIGLGSVPFVLISELFAANVRSLASSFLISWMWLSCFLLLRYFGALAISLGLHNTYYICATSTFLGSLYIFLCLPETRGKTEKQVEEALKGPLLVGLRRRRKSRGEP
ncbi:unnamed protein product [Plutella xylostella]|uniref:(diamondback moth) hypothetical protein n=1 Tax=Plutella xylostella TaxID=51655 RepID=A0A8S4FVY5_PLUXY|nr:unnamed protein product [Plutella xylostella]